MSCIISCALQQCLIRKAVRCYFPRTTHLCETRLMSTLSSISKKQSVDMNAHTDQGQFLMKGPLFVKAAKENQYVTRNALWSLIDWCHVTVQIHPVLHYWPYASELEAWYIIWTRLFLKNERNLTFKHQPLQTFLEWFLNCCLRFLMIGSLNRKSWDQ